MNNNRGFRIDKYNFVKWFDGVLQYDDNWKSYTVEKKNLMVHEFNDIIPFDFDSNDFIVWNDNWIALYWYGHVQYKSNRKWMDIVRYFRSLHNLPLRYIGITVINKRVRLDIRYGRENYYDIMEYRLWTNYSVY
jgi:hypothetical protein